MYDAKVVVTGGLGRIISNETETWMYTIRI